MHQLKLQSDNVKPEATKFAPGVQYIFSPPEVSCDNIEDYRSTVVKGKGPQAGVNCAADLALLMKRLLLDYWVAAFSLFSCSNVLCFSLVTHS